MNPFSSIFYAGQAISPNPPLSTRLLSGGVYNIPGGNWLVKPGAQTALQWKDSNSGLWRTFESGPVNAPIFVPSDGTNFRAINLSGTIVGATITAAGTAYTQANTTVTFGAPATGGTTATATPIIGGSLTFTVSGGTGYVNPMVIVPPPQLLGGTPGLCIPAEVAITLSTGALSSIAASFAGAGYITAPGNNVGTTTPAQLASNPNPFLSSNNLILVDPVGTGGTVTAAIANGTPTSGGLTGIVMNNNGAGYDGTHIPTVTVTSATGSSGTATALPSMALTAVTVGGTNTGYSSSIIGVTNLGASATPPKAVFGDPVLARAGRWTCAESGGVLGTPTIDDAGNGFQTVPLTEQIGNSTSDGSVNATFVSVVGGVTNTLLLWQVG